jgi:hypothetical protein
MTTIIAGDIGRLLARTPSLWEPLRGASLFISGGTGFFGIWLLEAILTANRERYVPVCSRAREELGLAPATSLDDAIHLTMRWAVAASIY